MAEKDISANTISHGLEIMEAVAASENHDGLTLNEIVDLVDLPRSNVYRYLRTLQKLGWLERNEITFRYHVGIKAYIVGQSFSVNRNLRENALPVMKSLTEGSFLAVHLGIPNETKIVYLEKMDSNKPVQMRSRPGMTVPCHSTAMGKAYLSTLSDSRIIALLNGHLEKRTPKTIDSMANLLENLVEIRHCGYSVDDEENEIGIGCVAAPVFNDKNLVGLLSVSTFISEFDKLQIPNYGERILKAAMEVSEKIGCKDYMGIWRDCIQKTE